MRKGAACSFHGLDGTLHAAPLRLPARGRAGWVRLALFAAAALVLAALLLLARQPLPKPRPEGAGIGLSVSDRAGQLLIRWNCDTPAIAEATGAEVEVDDGGIVRRIRLGPSLLRTGSLFYSRWSENASVRMVLERRGGPPVEERASFSGPPPEPERAALIPPAEPDAAPAGPPAPKRRQPRRLAVRPDRTQGPALAVLPRTPAPLPLEQRPLAVPAGAR